MYSWINMFNDAIYAKSQLPLKELHLEYQVKS